MSSARGYSRRHHLRNFEFVSLNGLARVNLYNPVFNDDWIEVQRPGSRRADHFTSYIESRCMAGAGEFHVFSKPRHRATKMGAFAGQSQKAAVFQAREVKTATDESRDRSGCKSIDRSGREDGSGISFTYLRLLRPQEGKCDCNKFSQTNQAEPDPEFGQE